MRHEGKHRWPKSCDGVIDSRQVQCWEVNNVAGNEERGDLATRSRDRLVAVQKAIQHKGTSRGGIAVGNDFTIGGIVDDLQRELGDALAVNGRKPVEPFEARQQSRIWSASVHAYLASKKTRCSSLGSVL